MALDIDKTFRLVQFVANKESRGWVSPAEFNIAAELAQIAVYSRLENAFLVNKRIQSDMRPFLKMDGVVHDGAKHAFPVDFRQLIRCRVEPTGQKIDEKTQAEYDDVADSSIVAPTTSYPICVVRNNGIYVYPGSIVSEITVEYIAKLTTVPTWAYTIVNGRPVYDSGSSVDFEFDDNLFLEISTLILSNVGMNIKDEAVTQYAMAFNK